MRRGGGGYTPTITNGALVKSDHVMGVTVSATGANSKANGKKKSNRQLIVRPMKIDIMFLVSARMGFRHRMKNFHYSLVLKERLGKI